jgi:hypothetical protein
MKPSVVITLMLFAVASCARSDTGMAGEEDALARELAGRVAGETRTCVSTNPQQNLRTIDSRTLAYEKGSILWINRLRSPCAAVNPYNTLIVEGSAGQYCRGDRIRGLEPGASIPGPICILRDWTPYRRR